MIAVFLSKSLRLTQFYGGKGAVLFLATLFPTERIPLRIFFYIIAGLKRMKRVQEVSEAEELYLARILHTILNACPANTHEIDAMQVRARFFNFLNVFV